MSVPGWYGKLPALGDFASRRLPPEWIAPWDGWLATGLHQLREAAPEAWLDNSLASLDTNLSEGSMVAAVRRSDINSRI